MYNYQIIIEYIGFRYVGWQIQKNGTSIQSLIETALKKAIQAAYIDDLKENADIKINERVFNLNQ